MAKLEELLESVADAKLRAELAVEVTALKNRTRFGLVYERHLPETVVVGDRDGLKVGDHVRTRKEASNGHDFRLVELDGEQATILSLEDGDERQVPLSNLLKVRRFGDPADVGLTPLGAVTRSDESPYHAVIDGENFHVSAPHRSLVRGDRNAVRREGPVVLIGRRGPDEVPVEGMSDGTRSALLGFADRRARTALSR